MSFTTTVVVWHLQVSLVRTHYTMGYICLFHRSEISFLTQHKYVRLFLWLRIVLSTLGCHAMLLQQKYNC